MTATTAYKEVLLRYFEEEIQGEAYFKGLKHHFNTTDQKLKLDLLSKTERVAAESVRPLLELYTLKPRSDADLAKVGLAWCARSVEMSWAAFIDDMATRYPGYIDDFKRLEAMAPEADLEFLEILTEHEVAAIEFAELERKNALESMEPLRRYIGAAQVSKNSTTTATENNDQR